MSVSSFAYRKWMDSLNRLYSHPYRMCKTRHSHCVEVFHISIRLRRYSLYNSSPIKISHNTCSTKFRCISHLGIKNNFDTNVSGDIHIEGAIRSKIIYNSILTPTEVREKWLSWKNRKKKCTEKKLTANSSPVYLKFLEEVPSVAIGEDSEEGNVIGGEEDDVVLPYKSHLDYYETFLRSEEKLSVNNLHEDKVEKETVATPSPSSNWMNDYECYNGDDELEQSWEFNYGTADITVPVSNVPCGGCGALLHCQDSAIPGYLPSEIFLKMPRAYLKTAICQRCHFMQYYDTVLSVSVSPSDYPKLLSEIKHKRALVVLMVDLLDFPCSVWPGIMDIIGGKHPVVVVGNKVDLLPQDSPGFLDHIKKCLISCLEKTRLSTANVKHVELISARTGFGVEELITRLQNMWDFKGDVYLIGCTNVGKSSLFNALLQSDFCKVKAVDLVQRATTSPWPGTTLNLLKFPILRPSGWRLYMRTQRLIAERERKIAEKKLRRLQLKQMNDIQYATLVGHIGRTFKTEEQEYPNDPFYAGKSTKQILMSLDSDDPEFRQSRWCFDTPGTVHSDQVINLLTTEELILTIPKKLLTPRTYCLKPETTLLIAGIGRIDYISGEKSMRFTVFASDQLPVTICHTADAETVYSSLLGSPLFRVPCGGQKRLEQWPSLEVHPDTITVEGIDWKESCADIVLSSAGWVALTPGKGHICKLRAWTPYGKGIYVRQPALLRYSVNFRGPRIRKTPAYKTGRAVYVKNY